MGWVWSVFYPLGMVNSSGKENCGIGSVAEVVRITLRSIDSRLY